jgi:glycosyltransferase involved in cell wall biosynthesis
MKILLVSQYFWPENFRINDLALGLQERGHEIHVLTGKPNYPKGAFYDGYSFFKKGNEEYKGIKIFRSNLFPRGNGSGLKLMVNYFSFAFFSSVKALFHKENYDFIFAYEPSPITVGIPAIIISKKLKIPLYFWVQDLWPESVSAAGKMNNKIILKSLNNLTKWIYKNSTLILIQSEGFREYILNQGVENDKIIYYPNSTESLYNLIEPSKDVVALMPKVPFTILFAGNIGESQDFECILEAAKILKDKSSDINFVILGNGRKKEFVLEKIKEYNLENNFHLLGSFPVNKMPHFFACANALLVTLKKKKIFSLTIPSKVQSYLACGKPIVGALDGEGAKVILESKSGLVAPSGDYKQLANKIFEIYEMNNQQRLELGKNARTHYEENFEREKLIDNLIDLVKK